MSKHREPGRPPLTLALIDDIAALVAQGVPPRVAAQSLGVHGVVFDEWIAAGERPSQGRWRQRRLVLAVERAGALLEVELARALAESDDWRAAAHVLERRWPERWLRKSVNAREDLHEVVPPDPFAELDNVMPFKPPIKPPSTPA